MSAKRPEPVGKRGGAADCVFCRIVEGSQKAELVHEDDHAVAFADINPQAPVHWLVVPRRHIGNVLDLEPFDGIVARLVHVACALTRAHSLADAGFRLVFNTNADGGQTVGHLHLHILAGRRMTWPPG